MRIFDTEHSIRIAIEERVLVRIARFRIARNAITILLGESGIGKSLLAKALYGLLDPDDFSVTIDNENYRNYLARTETKSLQRQSFFVFQEPSTHLNPLLTLVEQLNEGSLADAPNEQEILRTLWRGAGEHAVRQLLPLYPKPYRPSGGEKQRMLIAMAFKKMDAVLARGREDDALFVFDEPSGSLDNYYRDVFLEMLFERFRRRHASVLLITHDYSMIGKIHEAYAEFLPFIVFTELTVATDGVRLREFAPRDYLRWRESLRPVLRHDAAVVLRVEPEVEVHGRLLRLTQGRDSRTPTPLLLHRGSLVYLKAASGVGKTTLARTIMGLVQARRFSAQLYHLKLDQRTPLRIWRTQIWGKLMTLVFQHADEALNPESTVRSVFAGLPSFKRTPPHEVSELLKEMFDDVDPSFLRRKVKHLSGGQKQRLNLLRGLALETDVLILDEPLNGLDFESAGRVIAMIQRKQEQGKAILLISHNEEIFDRIVPPDCVYFLQAQPSSNTFSENELSD